VLQCVLQCVAVAVGHGGWHKTGVLGCVGGCLGVFGLFGVCWGVLQSVAMCCIVLQCVL